MRTVLLIDGLNNYLRNYLISPLMDTNGVPVGGAVGLVRSVKVLVREIQPDWVIVAWDGVGGSSRRRAMGAGYKEGRKPRLNREYDFSSPEENHENKIYQMGLATKYLGMLGVTQVDVPQCEADDVIAYLAKHVLDEERKFIVSTDRDFLQLADPLTTIYNPVKKEYYTDSTVKEKLGVIAENVIFMKALMGDKSDNIPGLRGFGEKTVVKLFPFLAERPVTMQEFLAFVDGQTGNKYSLVAENRELLIHNVEMMQLSEPIIGGAATRQIRAALVEPPQFKQFDLQVDFVRDGIQINDKDFVSTFRELRDRCRSSWPSRTEEIEEQ